MSVAVLLAGAGILAILGGLLVVRSLGTSGRVGRLLAATPEASIGAALELARDGSPRYVKVTGRISSDEEFPDDQNRPLVYRRTRIELERRTGSSAENGWQTVLDEREAVPFGVEARSSYIAVDDAALEDGLVVIPRVSEGKVNDLPPDLELDLPSELDAAARVRLTVTQLSAVEHATVCGQPVQREGAALMTAGLGRPLIVTSLDQASAMRVLAGTRRNRVVAAAFLISMGMSLLAAAVVAFFIGA